MQNTTRAAASPTREMKRRPTYAVASVDNALRLATWLQLEGSITVGEAAARLGVAPSTAHRLLQVLVYRDFAVRGEGRSGYRAGPVLELAGASPSRTGRLRAAARAPLEELSRDTGETANLVIRTADRVRFIASVEGRGSLRVTSREGMVFPVERTSGGLVLLAALPGEEVAELLVGRDAGELSDVLAQVRRARRSGVAVNLGRSERGVVAVGRLVRLSGEAVAAVSVAMPRSHYRAADLPAIATRLQHAALAIEGRMAEGG